MSHPNNYKGDQFADPPPIPHQYQHNVQYYDVRNQQQHIQHGYQDPTLQHYTFQPSHQNFQQHPPPQQYSQLGTQQQLYSQNLQTPSQSQQQYSQPAQPRQLCSQVAQPQHYAANQNQQLPPPPPPTFLPSTQPHHGHQPQPQKPTDPRNQRSNPAMVENSNFPSSDSGSNRVVLEKKRKKTEKNKKKKQARREKKMASRPGMNVDLDSELAEFTQAFKVSEYRKCTSRFKIDIPLTDRCHGVNNLGKKEIKIAHICMSFHCSGSCSPSCCKKESHRPLSASERKRFFDYLSEVKRRIEEERSNKKAKKPGSAYDDDEGFSGPILDVPTPYDNDELFDKNHSIDLSFQEIVKPFNVFEYHKCATKFGISIPQLDAYDGTDSRKGEICLVYHCKGNCSRHCSDKESHRQLTAGEHKRLHDYLSEVNNLMVEERGENSNEEKEKSMLKERPSTTINAEALTGEKKGTPEESIESGKRKADPTPDNSGSDRNQSNTNKRQRLDLDDGRFDDCSDDDEVEIVRTVSGKTGTPLVATPSRGNDGTAANPVDLTDAITPVTKALYTGLPGSNSYVDPKTDYSIVVSSSSSLDLEQTSDTTTASVAATKDTTTASVPIASSDRELVGDHHQAHSTDTIDPVAVSQAKSLRANMNEDLPGEIPKLLLSVSPNDKDSVNRSNKEATMKSASSMPTNQTEPPEQQRKEVLSPNSKSRKLKKLRAQLELAKKQHELAKLKEGLIKKDQELKQHNSQDAFRRNTLAPISALSASLIIDNIHESGPEHMVYFPNSELDHDLQLTQYKTILYGNKEEDEAMETLSSRKTQIERDLAILKERLESSLPTTAAASMSREDLQRKLEEAQANKDLSYWKLFVSKQDHILSSVDKQIKENATSLEQCGDEMANLERESRETLASIEVLKVRDATLAEMAAKSSMKILEMRQRLHEEQSQVKG